MKNRLYIFTFLAKKIITCSCFLSPVLLLCSCPYSSTYKLDNEPANLSNDAYVGKWAAMVSKGPGIQEPVKMILGKKSEREYDIYFTGNLKDLMYYKAFKEDTIKGTAFMSTVASRQFLNIQIKGQTYISEFIYANNKISLLPLCEHFTLKIIQTNAELRQALELHYKTRLFPLYDEPFCLKEMVRVN